MPQQTLSSDFATYDFGVYQINNNVWNKKDLVNGVDFTQSVTFDTSTVPNGITYRWDWGTPADTRVLAYPEITAGYHPWGQDGPTDLTAQVSDVKSLNVNFDLAIAGDTDKFNVAIEFWLTRKGADGVSDITTEVMIWLHNGNLADGAEFKFQYADGSYSAGAIVPDQPFQNELETWNYVALATNADYLKGTIDLHDVFVKLQRLGLVKETDTFGGFELGAEVTGGAGSLTVNSLSYDFGAYSITEGADRITGGEKADNIWGHGGNDTMYGGAGDDVLYGETGGDKLYGGDGNDTLIGGAGRDIMTGGAGADTFVFKEGDFGTRSRSEVIADFAPGDRIDLSGIDALSKTTGVNEAFAFIGESAFTGDGQVRVAYAGGNTFILLNTGGTLAPEFKLLLTGSVPLTAGDFIL
jgi:Ca2+-binding RTX toxin-like protein